MAVNRNAKAFTDALTTASLFHELFARPMRVFLCPEVGMRQVKEYAVYKGDSLIVMGTAEQCAAEMKTTAQYIYWMTTQAAQRRLAKRKNPDRCTIAFIVD